MSEKIGRYEIRGKLGRGAFGMVYKGEDPVIKRMAAIKVMSEATVGDPELVARFKREAEAAGGLNHRNIVTIYDLGEHNGLPFIAMEYLEGKDLERILKERQELSMDQRIDFIAQTADGLHYAHEKGIVHRDIKPANIRVLDDGTIKIMDFGIAKMSSHDMTRTGQFMGTVNYMSPEQIKAKKVDGRSDLFALGVMFYELVSYRKPFPGDSITAVIYKIVNENPPPLHELQGTPHAWLEGVIFKCLEKEAAKRWESTKALSAALRQRQQVAVSVGETHIDRTVNLARRDMEAGDPMTAIRRLDEILAQDPENTSVLKQKKAILAGLAVKNTETLISGGRLEQARDQLVKALADVGEDEEITRHLGEVESKIKANQAAQMLSTAERYLKEKRIEPAIETLQKAREIDPYNEEVRAALQQATDEKRKADVDLLLKDARARRDRGQIDAALERVKKAEELDPHSLDVRALQQELEREAEESTRKSGVQSAALEAELAMGKEEYDKAVQILQRAISLDPKNAELQRKLGEAKRGVEVMDAVARGTKLLRAKKRDEARAWFEKALKLDPQSASAQAGLRQTKAGLPTPVLVGGGVAAALAIGIVLWLVLKPSPALLAIRAADQAVQAGELVKAQEQYLAAATTLKGKDTERADAKAKFEGLYPEYLKKGEPSSFASAKEVLDKVGAWNGVDTVRERYGELAQLAGQRGLESADAGLLEASLAANTVFFEKYNMTVDADYRRLRAYFEFGTELMKKADDTSLEAGARLRLYEQTQKVFALIHYKDVGFGADKQASEARAKADVLAKLLGRIREFKSGVEESLRAAQGFEAERQWLKAADAYNNVLTLVTQYQDLKEGGVDLKLDEERATQGRETASRRHLDEIKSQSRDQQITALLGQAAQAEQSNNLALALDQYKALLQVDPAHPLAQSKVQEIGSRLETASALAKKGRGELDAGNLGAAEATLVEALGLVPSDPVLLGMRQELERRKGEDADRQKLEAALQEGDQLLAQKKLSEAEAKYKQVQDTATDREMLRRVGAKLDEILGLKRQSEIEPVVQRAQQLEASGDLAGALNAWREVEKLNRNDPRIKDNIPRLTREINKARIQELEGKLRQAFPNRDRDPSTFARVRKELQDLDSSNGVLREFNDVLAELQQVAGLKDALDKALAEANSLLQQNPDAAVAAIGRVNLASLSPRSNEGREALRKLKEDADPKLAAIRDKAGAAAAKGQAQRQAAEAKLTQARGALQNREAAEAERLALEAKREYPALAAAADAIIADARRLPPPATPAPKPKGCQEEISGLVASSSWRDAATKLDACLASGGSVDGALAGRVYFNASYAATCAGECDFATAAAFAEKCGKYDDSAAGPKVSNARWASTFARFTKCDSQLTALCGLITYK